MSSLGRQLDSNDLVLVVFSGETDICWLRLLKPGFRHCFACIHVDGQWIFYDPLAHRTELAVQTGMDSVDLEYRFRQHGCRVVRSHLHPISQTKLQPALFTCVEAVKRLLGGLSCPPGNFTGTCNPISQ